MQINLSPIINSDGRKIKLSEDIFLNASEKDNFKINNPVHFEGTASNIGGTIELSGNVTADILLICDRCTEEYEHLLKFDIFEQYKKSDSLSDTDENPDYNILEGSEIDLDYIVYTNLFMNLPSKSLCNPSCKGLCPSCGANLNKSECNCKSEVTNPAFDILDKLL